MPLIADVALARPGPWQLFFQTQGNFSLPRFHQLLSSMAGWSMLKQVELRALLSALGQPTDGGKAALVQRVATFMSDDLEAAAATRPADDDEGADRARPRQQSCGQWV